MSAHYALLCTTTYTNLHKFTVLYAMLSAAVSDCQSQVGIRNIYDAIYKVKCIKTEAIKDRQKILPWRQGTQGRRQTKEKCWVRVGCDAVAVTWLETTLRKWEMHLLEQYSSLSHSLILWRHCVCRPLYYADGLPILTIQFSYNFPKPTDRSALCFGSVL